MKAGVSGIKTFSFGQDLVFDAYVQFKVRLNFFQIFDSLVLLKIKHQLTKVIVIFLIDNQFLAGIHWVCKSHERSARNEALLPGPGHQQGLDCQYSGK